LGVVSKIASHQFKTRPKGGPAGRLTAMPKAWWTATRTLLTLGGIASA